MKKLWKVTVNEFGWRSPKTFYFESYKEVPPLILLYILLQPVLLLLDLAKLQK